jgi:putative transcriptional regulator
VQIPALAQRECKARSPALIVQKSALTGQVSAPSDGGVTILPPDPDRDALRVTLARLRNAREWTFDELAGRSGLARRTLIDLEHGRAAGTVTTWHALAHAFDVPIEQLLGSLCDDHTLPGSKGA